MTIKNLSDTEVWKPTKELGELYQVSNLGRVRRNWHGKYRILKPLNAKGYPYVTLFRSGIPRKQYIRQLVLEAFKDIDFETLVEQEIWKGVKGSEDLSNTEVWKGVKGFEKLYEVSNLGRVRRNWYGKFKYLKLGSTDGYRTVSLSRSGIQRTRKVHQLVLEAFKNINFETLPKGIEVHHKDDDRSNNQPHNLTLVTHSQNQKFGHARRKAKRLNQWKKDTVERLKIKNEPKTPKEPTLQDLQRAVWDEVKYKTSGLQNKELRVFLCIDG